MESRRRVRFNRRRQIELPTSHQGRRAKARRPRPLHQAINQCANRQARSLARSVVDAVARRDNARLLVDGMAAADDLGLTTAVPAQVTVFTDARLRPIQLGAQQIRFKQAAPSRLYWAGQPAMRVVQALYWMQTKVRDLWRRSGFRTFT